MTNFVSPAQSRSHAAVSSGDAPRLQRLWLPAPRWTMSPGTQRQLKPRAEVPLTRQPQSCRAVTACRSAQLTAPSADAVDGLAAGSGHTRVGHSPISESARQLWSHGAASGSAMQLQKRSNAEHASSRRQSGVPKTKTANGRPAKRMRTPAGKCGGNTSASITKHSEASPGGGPLPDGNTSTTLDRMLASVTAASRCAAIHGDAHATDDALVKQARQVSRPDPHHRCRQRCTCSNCARGWVSSHEFLRFALCMP